MQELVDDVFQVLRRANVRPTSGDLKALSLVLPNRHITTVAVRTTSPFADATARNRILHIAVDAPAATVDAALNGDFDLVTTDPARAIIASINLLPTDQPPRDQPMRRGKKPWGRWAVERTLILAGGEPLRQNTIATTTGLTHQAVSHALREHPYVRRSRNGVTADPALIDAWLIEYPGPGGLATHWYSLDEPGQQATAASTLATELDAAPLLSGDVAADRYAPWRRPASVRIYISEFIDFVAADFTPATRSEATLTAVIPDDPTIRTLATTLAVPAELSLADPLITLWDLTHTSTGPDRSEAADVLRKSIGLGCNRGATDR
ncbi:hypothetical protein [Antrihabitans cavernicola]|uniref:Uncharacterized protein n=1 Tax=Antrihabitans cavernicola TaxID=2495913 RepID=A0A5A7S1A7_9NOCA|nr:hypothetical protein [Spelaeibacter cavernicola]KAA0015974.1 hypothetical protein FOY51_26840 [Spelaeibacter cavernicola]